MSVCKAFIYPIGVRLWDYLASVKASLYLITSRSIFSASGWRMRDSFGGGVVIAGTATSIVSGHSDKATATLSPF